MMRKKSNSNFVADGPREGWAFFEKTNTWRRTPSPSGASPDYFPKEWGDWVAVSRPKGWLPDENTRLNLGSSLHAATNETGEAGAGSGGGMKIGAGKKPQPFGWHGYYGQTGGGISGGHEVRGKVTPPAKAGRAAPAKPASRPAAPLYPGGRVRATSANDDAKRPDPNPEALTTKTREQVQAVLDKDTGTKSVNMNSGYRSGDQGSHGEGRAADLNKVNDQKVSDAVDPAVPAEQREAMRDRLVEIQRAAKGNQEVEAYIDPLGGFFRPKDQGGNGDGREANAEEKHDHRHHIHITIRK